MNPEKKKRKRGEALASTYKAICEFAEENGYIPSSNDLAMILGKSEQTIRDNVAELVDDGKLRRIDFHRYMIVGYKLVREERLKIHTPIYNSPSGTLGEVNAQARAEGKTYGQLQAEYMTGRR